MGTNIAAYTGARLGEVAQLTTNDIELRDNIWCFSFNNQNGKKIKTQSSIRRVPIHPQLTDKQVFPYFVKELVGHKHNSITYDIYAGKPPMKVLLEECVSKINYCD